MLAFSVHDIELMPPHHQVAESGLCFVPTSESRVLEGAQYGSTWVRADYVTKAIEQFAPGRWSRRLPRGLCNYQDLWLVADEAIAGSETAPLDAGPEGGIELAEVVRPGELELRGWVAERWPDAQVERIEALLDGEIVGRCRPSALSAAERARERRAAADSGPAAEPGAAPASAAHAEYRASWRLSCALPVPLSLSSAVLIVRATSTLGTSNIVHVSSVQSAVAESWQRHYWRAQFDVRELVESIEAGRLWRLRRSWVALKRRLGLTRDDGSIPWRW